jgi:hypothetical protein
MGSNFSRNLVKKVVLFFVKKSTGIEISDLNSGMKMMGVAKALSIGYPFRKQNHEILRVILLVCHRIGELSESQPQLF